MKASNNKPSLESINEFLRHQHIVVAGASRNRKKFGNIVFRDLLNKGYQVVPVNPNTEELEGYTCYPNLRNLPKKADALLLLTPPQQSLTLLEEAVQQGIYHIWIQQGAESSEVIKFCVDNHLHFISGPCILMHLEPVKNIHKVHRFLSKVFRTYPN